jgi:thioredoxin-related protein
MMAGVDVLLNRRQLFIVAASLGATELVQAQETGLSVPNSLPEELAAALRKRGPLLVMVSLPGCPFCKIARTNYLLPLQRQTGLAMVQVDMRNRQMVVGLDGVSQTQDQLVRGWAIKIAPTVLFFGAGGAEVAERLVGGYIPDFYGYYLDERVRAAKLAVVG